MTDLYVIRRANGQLYGGTADRKAIWVWSRPNESPAIFVDREKAETRLRGLRAEGIDCRVETAKVIPA